MTLKRGWFWDICLRAGQFSEHVIALAATGTGKTWVMLLGEIIPGLAKSGVPMLLTTAKSSDKNDYEAVLKRKAPYIVFGPNENYYFDYLTWLLDRGISEAGVANLLISGLEDESGMEEAVWRNNLRSLLADVLLLLQVMNKVSLRNIDILAKEALNFEPDTDYSKLPEDSLYSEALLFPLEKISAERKKSFNEALIYLGDTLPGIASRTRRCIVLEWNPVSQALQRPPLSGLFQASEQGTSVTPDLLLEDQISVILDLPTGVDRRPSQIALSIWLEALRIGAWQRKKRHLVCAVLDEFQDANVSGIIADYLATSRSSGVSLFLLTQSLTALVDKSGRERAQALVTAPGTTIIGPNGSGELERTAEFLGQEPEEFESIKPAKDHWKKVFNTVILRKSETYRVKFGRKPITTTIRAIYRFAYLSLFFICAGIIIPMPGGIKLIHQQAISKLGLAQRPVKLHTIDLKAPSKATVSLLTAAELALHLGERREACRLWRLVADELPQPNKTYAAANAVLVCRSIGQSVTDIELSIRSALL